MENHWIWAALVPFLLVLLLVAKVALLVKRSPSSIRIRGLGVDIHIKYPEDSDE